MGEVIITSNSNKNSSTNVVKATKKKQKEIRNLKQKIRLASKDLTSASFKVTMAITLLTMALNWYISGLFKGIPVARLPFTPLSIFRKLTHRLLEGEDYKDASSHLILMLASMSVRGSIAKIFGGGPPKIIGKVGAFDMPYIEK